MMWTTIASHGIITVYQNLMWQTAFKKKSCTNQDWGFSMFGKGEIWSFFFLSFFLFMKAGNQILSLGALSEDQVYPLKLKGISICYSALKSALCGNYICFGIFRLYGDNHFDNVLQAFVRMLLSVSHSDLLVSNYSSWESLREIWNNTTTGFILL